MTGRPLNCSRRVVLGGAVAALVAPAAGPADASTSWRLLPERYVPAVSAAARPVAPGYLGTMVAGGPQGIPLAKLKDGRLVVHPTQIGNLLNLHLDSYDATADRRHLDLVARIGQAMAGRAVERQGALFLGYEFENITGSHNLPNPWFSAMGQSKFPRAFHRLARATGERKWYGYRDQTLRAFRLPPVTSQPSLPWIAGVDTNNCLWLEEAPEQDAKFSTVFNGHFFALAELAQYQRISADPAVADLVSGAAATLDFYRNLCRQAGRYSNYYANVEAQISSYHTIHANMYRTLWEATGATRFGRTVDQMATDWPISSGTSTLRLRQTRLWVLRSTSIRTAPQAWTPTAPVDVQSTARGKWVGTPGVWNYMNSGPRQGWYVQEGPAAYRTNLLTDRMLFTRPRPVVVPAGRPITARRWDDKGNSTVVRQLTPTTQSTAHSAERAVLGGRHQIKMLDGAFAGLWIEEGQVRYA